MQSGRHSMLIFLATTKIQFSACGGGLIALGICAYVFFYFGWLGLQDFKTAWREGKIYGKDGVYIKKENPRLFFVRLCVFPLCFAALPGFIVALGAPRVALDCGF
jgi:hypothetical protein